MFWQLEILWELHINDKTDMGEIFSTPSASNYGSLSPWRSPLTAVVCDWAVYQRAHVAPAPPGDV